VILHPTVVATAPVRRPGVPTHRVGWLLAVALGVALVVVLALTLGPVIASLATSTTGDRPVPTASPQAAPVPPPPR
jgi:hypothetical protein